MEIKEIAKNLDYEKLAFYIKNLPKEFFEDINVIKKEIVEIEKRLEKIKNFEEKAENIEDSLNILLMELINLKNSIKFLENIQADISKGG
ncbi:MAG: hypothetical protein QXO40_04360, partial [Candidatus Aenigmatarchaeota archaeon]